MTETQANQFGQVFGELLTHPRTMALGPGSPNVAVKDELQKLSVDRAFEGREVADRDMAEAAIAGVWLYHDYLDESHRISQGIKTPTGSYWHGIMHRREPDYPNAKHWFGRAGDHPVFRPLREDAVVLAEQARDSRAASIAQAAEWDPFAFVDLCAEATQDDNGALRDLCMKIQMREWWLLFEYSYAKAVGESF